jgi:hypothetical protein
MKKLIVLMLLTSITGHSSAQYDRTANLIPSTNTERIFNNPAPGKLQKRFEFLLGKGNKMVLELTNINQIDQLVNPDSLVSKVWSALQPFYDSLSKPLTSRRIDYIYAGVDEKVRISEYAQPAEIFRIKDNGITQLKMEQDTLRIKLYTKGKTITIKNQSGNTFLLHPYFIMLVLNNISDVASLSTDELSKGMALLRDDLNKNEKVLKTKASYSRYYALYNVQTGKRISPAKGNIAWGKRKELIPFIPVGMQYVRGEWVPSTGVGGEWKTTNGNATRYFRLYWEPLFHFSRNADNKLTTDVNSFVAFKYTENTKEPTSKNLIFAVNFSAGYLVDRQGELFEKNTIKFSLPGFQMKNVLLEPEFVFNKLFKDFSPSLKLSLYFE